MMQDHASIASVSCLEDGTTRKCDGEDTTGLRREDTKATGIRYSSCGTIDTLGEGGRHELELHQSVGYAQ